MGLSVKAISYRLDEEEVDTPSIAITTRAPELLKSIFSIYDLREAVKNYLSDFFR